MKFLQGYLAGFMAAALAWSLPQPPRQRPAPHPQALQNSEYQTHTGSSEYVPSEFEHMSLYHGNTASSNPPVVHGYEHLLPHFNVEMNSDEVHQTEHYGLMPDPYLYEHFTRQQEAGFAREDEMHHHHPQVASSSRRKSKGKQPVELEQEMRSNTFQGANDLVNNSHQERTLDHRHVNRIASSSTFASDETLHNQETEHEEEEEEEDVEVFNNDDESDGIDSDEVEAPVKKGGRPRKPGSRRESERLATTIFLQIWNRRGLYQEMEPESLAESIAFWEIDQEGGFTPRQIARRTLKMIQEYRPDSQYPNYLGRYSEYMAKIHNQVLTARYHMNKEARFMTMRREQKSLYNQIALERAIKSIHETIKATGGYLEYQPMSATKKRDSRPIMAKIIGGLKRILQANEIDLNRADFQTLINASFSLENIKGLTKWDVLKYIREYLIDTRGLDEEQTATFSRQARLKLQKYTYDTLEPEVKEEKLRLKRLNRQAKRNNAGN